MKVINKQRSSNNNQHNSISNCKKKHKTFSRSRSKSDRNVIDKKEKYGKQMKKINTITKVRTKGKKFIEGKSNRLSCYAYNSFVGITRERNEDKISIQTNISLPHENINATFPIIHYFSIFDGHGGDKCSTFLQDNLFNYIINDPELILNPKSVLMRAFIKAETNFVNQAKPLNLIDGYDKSGSCALVLLIINNTCYCAGLGDSLGFYSHSGFSNVFQLNTEHKPNNESELKRINKEGGSVYQQSQNLFNPPWRMLPGKLSVSRAIGDIDSKIEALGGNCEVLIAIPEVTSFEIKDESDFIVLGSDGIFDALTIKDICDIVLHQIHIRNEDGNQLFLTKNICDDIINQSMQKGSTDNVSCIVITFAHLFSNTINVHKSTKTIKSKIIQSDNSIANEFDSDYLYSLHSNFTKAKEKTKTNCNNIKKVLLFQKPFAKMTASENYNSRYSNTK